MARAKIRDAPVKSEKQTMIFNRSRFRAWYFKARQKWKRLTSSSLKFMGWLVDWKRPARLAVVVGVVWIVTLGMLWNQYNGWDSRYQGIYVEAWGTAFDILVVGILLTLFAAAQERHSGIERHLEEIADFKKWGHSEEGRLRLAGSIRRLNKLGKTDIDFSGLRLSNFSLRDHDIGSIRGSTFSTGYWIETPSKNATVLEGVDFSDVDCRGVTFHTGSMLATAFAGTSLSFINANLEDAKFDGSRLAWTTARKLNKDDWYEDMGEDEEGRPLPQLQTYVPEFFEANLRGCSFRRVQFDNADFRGADNILDADFDGAAFKNCLFDDEVRDQILSGAIARKAAPTAEASAREWKN